MLNALVVASILILFVGYDIILPLARLFSPRRAFATTEAFARRGVRRIFSLMRSFRGVSLEFENASGSELPGRFLLVANHQSILDIPLCIELFPGSALRFVAKWELRAGIPFVSRILRSQGHALVRRDGEAKQAMRSIARFARRCLREGTCPVIFPEGTRSPGGGVGTFHTAGVRKILGETPLPMVIAAIEGGWRVAGLKGILRDLGGTRFRVRVIEVTAILEGKGRVLEALSRARMDIAASLAEMRRDTAPAAAGAAAGLEAPSGGQKKEPPNGGSRILR
jgi:1-acyl-sn-glycerol-3-phosphate acyltransferase